MYLTDSNILIYSYQEEYKYLRITFFEPSVFISEISRVEVLGYHKLTLEEDGYYTDLFKIVPIIYPNQDIFDTAIKVRRLHNLKLGDSLIAATALVNNLTLYTRNISDFEKVELLKCVNPIK